MGPVSPAVADGGMPKNLITDFGIPFACLQFHSPKTGNGGLGKTPENGCDQLLKARGDEIAGKDPLKVTYSA